MSLVSTDWVEKNNKNLKIIDCSWHMPNAYRNGYNEYLQSHIENSIFFDLDKNSNFNTDLPHMLVNNNEWEKKSALSFAKKKNFFNSDENIQKKLSKMARAGFPYEICKDVLKID